MPHHWGEFARQNVIMREVSSLAGQLLMDIAPLTSLRPDSHASITDCLHYVTLRPGAVGTYGPVNTWIRLLMAAMELLRAPARL